MQMSVTFMENNQECKNVMRTFKFNWVKENFDYFRAPIEAYSLIEIMHYYRQRGQYIQTADVDLTYVCDKYWCNKQ